MMTRATLSFVFTLFLSLLGLSCTARPSETMTRGGDQARAQSPSDPSVEQCTQPIRQIDAAYMRAHVYDYRESPDEFVFKGLHPTVILFYSERDEASRSLLPKVEAIAKRYASKISVYGVNIAREPELADLYGLRTGQHEDAALSEGGSRVPRVPMLLFIPLEGVPQQVVGDLSLDYLERATERASCHALVLALCSRWDMSLGYPFLPLGYPYLQLFSVLISSYYLVCMRLFRWGTFEGYALGLCFLS